MGWVVAWGRGCGACESVTGSQAGRGLADTDAVQEQELPPLPGELVSRVATCGQPSSIPGPRQLAASPHLGEQVVHHVGADVVVDLVEDAVVAVNGGQAAAEVAPLLAAEPARGGGGAGGAAVKLGAPGQRF